MKNSIVEIIAENAVNNPDRLCIVDGRGEFTYADIWHAALRAAYVLQELGVHKDHCVLAECTQNADYMICNFACSLLGAYFVPVEHKATVFNVQAIYEETDAVLLICEKAYDFSANIISYGEVVKVEGAQLEKWNFPEGDDTAEILYTTGTTGKSKGIEMCHKNNVAIAENISSGVEMREGNVELIPLPLSHAHGLRCSYADFYKNGTVVITDGVTRVLEIYQLIKKYHVTALDLSPTAASVLLKMSRGRFAEFNDQLEYIQIGTAAVPEELKEELCRQFPDVRIYNVYASTESGRSCALNFNSDDDKKYCIGFPNRTVKFIITDAERNEIQSDETHTGLLACKSPTNMKGYWKQPELTAQIMQNGFVYTNDEAYIDERGFIFVLGRKDDIINYKGIKIAPEEIEEIVIQYEEIKDCACIPVADQVAGQVPKIFLVLKEEEKFDRAAFARFMEEHIDANKIPKYIEVIEKIPRAFNGKIQRKKLMV